MIPIVENNSFKQLIVKYYPFILSVLFLILTLLGLFYDFLYYSKFDINILHYTTAEDFFFSWIKSASAPKLIIFSSFGIFIQFFNDIISRNQVMINLRKLIVMRWIKMLIVFLVSFSLEIYFIESAYILLFSIYLFILLRRKYERINFTHNYYLNQIKTFLVIFTISIFFYLGLSAKQDYDAINTNTQQNIYNITLTNKTKLNSCQLIGTKNSFHFYQNINKNILIIPTNNIVLIEKFVNPKFQEEINYIRVLKKELFRFYSTYTK